VRCFSPHRVLHRTQWIFRADGACRKMLMAEINRLHARVWIPFALMALAACTPANDPAQAVER
jgi:hypothetical protein